MSWYPLLLSLHLVGIVCWFAGLFYLVRLFVYHREALDKPEPEQTILREQFALMEKRLWKVILVPAMWVTLITGGVLLYRTQVWDLPWFHIKALFLVLLFGYHSYCRRILGGLDRGEKKWSSTGLRGYNEIATMLLFAIVFCAKLKSPQAIGLSLGGLLVLGLGLWGAVKMFKRKR